MPAASAVLLMRLWLTAPNATPGKTCHGATRGLVQGLVGNHRQLAFPTHAACRRAQQRLQGAFLLSLPINARKGTCLRAEKRASGDGLTTGIPGHGAARVGEGAKSDQHPWALRTHDASGQVPRRLQGRNGGDCPFEKWESAPELFRLSHYSRPEVANQVAAEKAARRNCGEACRAAQLGSTKASRERERPEEAPGASSGRSRSRLAFGMRALRSPQKLSRYRGCGITSPLRNRRRPPTTMARTPPRTANTQELGSGLTKSWGGRRVTEGPLPASEAQGQGIGVDDQERVRRKRRLVGEDRELQ
jgi:hypothetical protein